MACSLSQHSKQINIVNLPVCGAMQLIDLRLPFEKRDDDQYVKTVDNLAHVFENGLTQRPENDFQGPGNEHDDEQSKVKEEANAAFVDVLLRPAFLNADATVLVLLPVNSSRSYCVDSNSQ